MIEIPLPPRLCAEIFNYALISDKSSKKSRAETQKRRDFFVRDILRLCMDCKTIVILTAAYVILGNLEILL